VQDGTTAAAGEGVAGCSHGDLQLREGEGVVPQLKIGVGIKPMKELTERSKTDGDAARRRRHFVGWRAVRRCPRATPHQGNSPGPLKKDLAIEGGGCGQLGQGLPLKARESV
jgi:hypothetical protein